MPKERGRRSIKVGRVLRIFCEGAKTEPLYIKSYINFFRTKSKKRVAEIEPTKKNTPLQLVQEAIDHKKRNPINDEYWVVYDRECTSKYDESAHAKAYNLANQHEINLAISNVCFEFWLTLHIDGPRSSYQNYDDLIKHSSLNEYCKKSIGKPYEKANGSIFNVLRQGIKTARDDAIKINLTALKSAEKGKDKPYHLNPYTDVPKLLDAIDNW
jgi:hypothetical protein